MDSYGRRIIAVTGTGTFLSVVNTSSLLIAIPTIILSLNVSFFLAIWVIVAYSLALTVLTPILGKYSDIVGRKRLYSYGYIVFFLGSVVSAASFSGNLLLAGRIIQGIGGAFLFSNSLAIITDTFKAVELRQAMGVNAAILALGTSVGPLIGGLLTAVSWRAIFIFNIPISLLGYLYSSRVIREISPGRKGGIDTRGALLLSLTIILGVVFMTVLPETGIISGIVAVTLSLTIIFLMLFLYEERKSEKPIINPEIFRNPVLTVSTLALSFGSVTRFSVLFLLTLLFQGPLHFSALMAGILIVPYAGSMGVFSYLSGIIKQKTSDTALEVAGLVFSGIGSIVLGLAVSLDSGYVFLALAMALAGAGSGIFYTPNSTLIMLSAPPRIRGETAGIRTLMVNLGSVVGLTLVFLMISAYVPSSIVGSIFLGLTSSDLSSYISLFYSASELVLYISGALSLVPVLLIMFNNLWKKQ